MTVFRDAGGVLYSLYGTKVERATAALPQTTTSTLFTIATGRILVTSIVGEVTTVIQTQADNTKLTFDPTDAGATQDLCAVLDITADAVGTMYSITGTPATAMQDALNFLPPSKALANPILLKPGAILLDCAASNTGSVKWTLCYIAYDSGATAVAS
jgi:hypothetical protein